MVHRLMHGGVGGWVGGCTLMVMSGGEELRMRRRPTASALAGSVALWGVQLLAWPGGAWPGGAWPGLVSRRGFSYALIKTAIVHSFNT